MIQAPNGDASIVAGDINLTHQDLTSVFNITSFGLMTINAGGLLQIGTAGAILLNAGLYINMTSLGNVSIGSGNVLGADTEIEKVGFKENQIYKAGDDDLEIDNVSSIINIQPITINSLSNVNIYGRNFYTSGNDATVVGNFTASNIFTNGISSLYISTSALVASSINVAYIEPASISTNLLSTGSLITSSLTVPYIEPASISTNLLSTASLYTSSLNVSSIVYNGDVVNSVGSSNMNSGFIYIPGGSNVPTGTPATYPNAYPLYLLNDGVQTKLFAYVNGGWDAI
jgi:hypothetical protein